MNNFDTELYGIFFSNEKTYYLKQLEKYQSGKRLSFNFSVILIGAFWFIYRKLYKESLYILLGAMGLTAVHFLIIKESVSKESAVGFFLLFVLFLWIVLGFMANKIYIRKAEAVILTAKYNSDDPEKIRAEVARKGGYSSYGVIIVIVILFSAMFFL